MRNPLSLSQSRLLQKLHFGGAGALGQQLDQASHLTWRHAVCAQARPTRPQRLCYTPAAQSGGCPPPIPGRPGPCWPTSLDGAHCSPSLLACQAWTHRGAFLCPEVSAPRPSTSGASAESQPLSPRPIWPTLGPPHLGRGGATLPARRPSRGLCSSHAAEQGAKAGGCFGSAGPDPRRDLGDQRLWGAAPVPSHSHTTDWGSRLNPKDWSARF